MVGHVIKSCKSRRAAQKIWPRDHKTMGEFIDEKLVYTLSQDIMDSHLA